jgi:hypothetical protein
LSSCNLFVLALSCISHQGQFLSKYAGSTRSPSHSLHSTARASGPVSRIEQLVPVFHPQCEHCTFKSVFSSQSGLGLNCSTDKTNAIGAPASSKPESGGGDSGGWSRWEDGIWVDPSRLTKFQKVLGHAVTIGYAYYYFQCVASFPYYNSCC